MCVSCRGDFLNEVHEFFFAWWSLVEEIFKMKCMSFSQKYFSLVFKKRKRYFSALEGFASLQIMFRTAGGEARADRFFGRIRHICSSLQRGAVQIHWSGLISGLSLRLPWLLAPRETPTWRKSRFPLTTSLRLPRLLAPRETLTGRGSLRKSRSSKRSRKSSLRKSRKSRKTRKSRSRKTSLRKRAPCLTCLRLLVGTWKASSRKNRSSSLEARGRVLTGLGHWAKFKRHWAAGEALC